MKIFTKENLFAMSKNILNNVYKNWRLDAETQMRLDNQLAMTEFDICKDDNIAENYEKYLDKLRKIETIGKMKGKTARKELNKFMRTEE